MKKVALLTLALATAAVFAAPAFAGLEHHAMHEEAAVQAGNMSNLDDMMQDSMEKMHAQMEKINKAKKPKERLKLLQEHNDSMRDSIHMMREMMGWKMAGDQCDHKRGGGKADDHCDHMKKDHMADGYKAGDQCDHKRGGNMANANADPAPAAQSTLDQLSAADKTSSGAAKKIWVCPMHPEVAQDHPGYCPKCGMDLTEVEQPVAAAQPEPASMTGTTEKRMGMTLMLMLMEQMIEHNKAVMDLLK